MEKTDRPKKKEKTCEEKVAILELLDQVKNGQVKLTEVHIVWDKMYSYKETYMEKISSQSWNSFIGGVFERLVYYVMKNYVSQISKLPEFKNVALFT